MNAQDGFTKAVPLKRVTVRELVTQHGDDWRFHASTGYRGHADHVTFDGVERISMWLMEKGTAPRIRPMELFHVDERPPIHLDFVYPPIPDRSCDYAAYRDPEGLVGRGRTPFAAINDLVEQESEQ